MAQANIKPPILRTGDNYETWKTKIKLWERCTNVARDARAPAVALMLEGAAQAAVIKIPIDTLASDEGMEELLKKLDKLFQEDIDQITYSVYDNFEKFRKTDGMSMTEYLVEFELLYDKAKEYNNVLTEPVLAYRLLKGANLSEHKQELARATCAKWTYETLKVQLKKIFDKSANNDGEASYSNSTGITNEFSELHIKSEPCKFTQSHEEEDTYFTRMKPNYNRSYNRDRRYDENKRRDRDESQAQLNPISNGVRMKCISCKSVYHLIRDCPYKNSHRSSNQNWRNSPVHRTYMSENDNEEADEVFIQLFMSSLIKSEETEKEISECYVSTLVGECLQKCILDSGCNQNVAGVEWSNDYIDSLNEDDKRKVKTFSSNTKFKFGDGKTHSAIKKVNVPAEIGKKKVMIEYHVVNAELPLLLSKNGMKEAKCKMDYANEKVEMFGRQVQPGFTKSGHYTIALNPKVQAGTHENAKVNVLFSVKDFPEKSFEDKKKMMRKIHKTFGHPSETRLKKLIKDGGIEDSEIMKSIEQVTNECEICIKYKRTPSHPIVSTSLARHFNEVVTLDLFFHNKIPIMHICDVATRFSRASVLPSKNKNSVINAFCVLWVSLFGPPQKILSDNGGEFTSHDFREMGEKLNTQVLSTAAESPWSNGINERHHALITNMLEKILEENKFPLQVALSWAVSAKNALANVYGFSPNQLVFGVNPNYPSILTNELPALENESNSKNVLTQMQAREAAREAFIKAESCEKLKRAINRKVRNVTSLEFEVGEEVFYKRESEGRWRGPAKIIGKDGKCVIIKHQGSIVSVPSCMITHRSCTENDTSLDENKNQQNLSKEKIKPTPAIKENNESEDEWEIRTVEQVENLEQNVVDSEDEWELGFDFDFQEEGDEHQNVVDAEDEEEDAQEEVGEIVAEQAQRKRGRPTKKTKPKIDLPPINAIIKYQLKNNEDIYIAKVLSKAGKSTGANRYCLNVCNLQSDEKICIDFGKHIDKWKRYDDHDKHNEDEEILFGTVLETREVKEAKQQEIQKWKNYNVFESLPDEGQRTTSVRWVITNKNDVYKARLVARGYEETCFKDIRKDSPTIGKPTFRLTLAIIASKQWEANSLDVQAAYLQGQTVDREILLKPPPEAEEPNMLWKLKKAVYGLGDGGRNWYLQVETEITNLNGKKSIYDPAIFIWYDADEILQGILAAHVDDFLWGGTKIFQTDVIENLKKKFKISNEQQGKFKHLGLQIEQNKYEITVNQTAYANEIQFLDYDRTKNKDQPLNDIERKDLQSFVGQIQWISSQTRPDLSFNACEASVEFTNATVNTIHKANKAIRKIKNHEVKLRYPCLGDLSKCTILCFSDASLKNLPGNQSQYGYIIFLSKNNQVVPITWKSAKCKRIVHSTTASECLALFEGAGASYYLRKILTEIYKINENEIPIECFVDNKNLYQALNTTKTVTDPRVLADIAELRDKIKQKEITKINWIEGENQLANVLTKFTASTESLLAVLEKNQI